MSKAIGIDYGTKRVGISISDSSQLIASGLTTVVNKNIFQFLSELFNKQDIDTIVIGNARNLDGTNTDISLEIEKFTTKLKIKYPNKQICMIDERFTSKIAFQSIIDSGVKKEKRKDKSLIDEVSATIILQDYLSYK
ncbi:MAG: Holliday junction resolvase RuvX [Flavobacteriales bacterium]|nr:Holliday junction resolvase RuvX [Flavobacteriales bacterium]